MTQKKVNSIKTFIIDCPQCKARVAAIEKGRIDNFGYIEEVGEPYGGRLYMGSCPQCHTSLVGESSQIGFEGLDSEYDQWSDIIRVYPKPAKVFSSYRIPRSVNVSLSEAERALQVNANIAACAMLGRTLEAICRDVIDQQTKQKSANTQPTPTTKQKPIMLGEGIRKLKAMNVIDDRLFEWSQQLQAFRNLAAHADEGTAISREDAEDLQTFVYAIIEYIYDLTDRYNEFKSRANRAVKIRRPSIAPIPTQ
jgi:hypothetical protein